MSRSNEFLPAELYQYVVDVSVVEPPILAKLREETASHPRAVMQIPPDQGQVIKVLLALTKARKTLEVGVFTGYSSLVTALALPEDGKVIACDISEEFTATARRYWHEAGVDHKVDLRIGPATETLQKLAGEGHAGEIDFAFIDADKGGYCDYLDLALPLVRAGGLLAFDNTLYHGTVVDAHSEDANTKAIRRFNEYIAADTRVISALLPMADGLTLAVKK